MSGRRFWLFFSPSGKRNTPHQIQKNLLEHLSNLYKRDKVFDFSTHILKPDRVKVILLNSDFQETGCEAYTRFFLEKSQTVDKYDVHRLINITSQLVRGFIGIDRIVIHACQGTIISLFLNTIMGGQNANASKLKQTSASDLTSLQTGKR